jgi:hypothetical protein
MIEKGNSRAGWLPPGATPLGVTMEDPNFLKFIDTMSDLKNVGGNCHFEWLLFEKINTGEKQIGELTITEFLELHEAANREYNEIEAIRRERIARKLQEQSTPE